MKYAFIALITLYLITYGCSSDDSKKDTDTKKKVEHVTVEKSQPAATLPAETATVLKAEPVETPPVVQEQSTSLKILPPATVPETAGEKQVAEQPAETAPEVQQSAQLAEIQAAVMANREDTLVMPCGRVVLQKDFPCIIPCPMMQQQEGPIAQEQVPTQQVPQELAAPGTAEDELTAAMQKMVEATNEMALVTRQMVSATEKMLKATKGAAGEVVAPGKEILESEKPAEAVKQPADAGAQPQPPLPQTEPQTQTPSPEKSVVESMKEVVTAAKEVIEVTNEAISKAIEAKK